MLRFEERFRFIDVDIVVRTNSRRFREKMAYLDSYFRSPDPGTPALIFSAIESDGRFSVYEHETHVYTGEEFWALAVLERQMAASALERLGQFYQLHAGAASKAGVGLLFPGVSKSGKSTLMFGLLARGFRYLSDDVILFDPETLRMTPFPRSLSLKGEARNLAMRICPALGKEGPARTFHKRDPWYLNPSDVRAEPWGQTCYADCLIFPRYNPGQPSGLTEMGRAWAAATLAHQTLNLPQYPGERGLDLVTRLVHRARCYRLSVDNLEEAVSTISDLVGDD